MADISFSVTIGGVEYDYCAVPFKFENVLDATLDTATLQVDRVSANIIPPLTPVNLAVKSNSAWGGEQSVTFEYVVSADEAEESPVGSGLYRHQLVLVEPTKISEGVICDSLCVTHPGGNVYTKNAKPVVPVEEE